MQVASWLRRAVGVFFVCLAARAGAQAPESWWAPMARDVASAIWVDVDAGGFGPAQELARLELRRHPTAGVRGYWITHLRAAYATARALPGVDGEDVRTSQVYLAMLLDCDRRTWLVAGAYGAVDAAAETVLAPLSHTGLEATDVALDRVTRLACHQVLAAETRTAPEGAVLVDLWMP